ncbi:MAG: response regulator [Rhodospirillaceae bacterium]
MTNIDLRHLNILIVEPNLLLRSVFRQVLRELGATQVETVTSADAAFDAFQDGDIDIVLADWSRSCDGLELLRRLRDEHESKNPFVPVIITSANTKPQSVIVARDGGM